MPKRVFVYGSNTAHALVTAYSSDAARAGFVGRHSLISAMNGPSRVQVDVPSTFTASAARLVRLDVEGALEQELTRTASTLDLLLWDLDDERLGVHELSDGSFLTRSPVLQGSALAGASIIRDIPFGSADHLRLWMRAATAFAVLLRNLGLADKAYALRLPWASTDENGKSVELPFGLRSGEANTYFEPYFRHLRNLGIPVVAEDRTTASARHQKGRSPLNLSDADYHRLSAQLAGAVQPDPDAAAGAGFWNRDQRHDAQILHWTDPGQLQSRIPGRTEHVVAPRPKLGEKYPLKFLVQNTGSDTLLVISHGALARGKYQIPRFEWLDTLRSRPENLMFLADGALEAHPELELAWFTGDATDDLTARYSETVKTVAGQLGAAKVLFIGGSGGGFASLALAAGSPGSRALVFNPQTAIRKYWNTAVSAYQQTLFPGMTTTAGLDALGQRVSAVERVAAARPETYQVNYVQNDDDAFHLGNHLAPFAATLGILPSTGSTEDGNVQLIVERFAAGHNMPYRAVLNDFVDLTLADWGTDLRQWAPDEHGHLLQDTPA